MRQCAPDKAYEPILPLKLCTIRKFWCILYLYRSEWYEDLQGNKAEFSYFIDSSLGK
ncbi:hypothetical protein ccbrp13_62200 [Ktedonobacteria bacterium brp13]|nr:hypothetical protein ccbrp13_62200 [Ktedonobacteria bacterium brp13]